MVRKLVPKERLLGYKAGEGWERMCEFLEIPVPDDEFSVAKEQATFGDRTGVGIGLALQRVAMRVVPMLVAVMAVAIGSWMYAWR